MNSDTIRMMVDSSKALTVRCFRCDAEIGARCTSKTGRACPPHIERRRLYWNNFMRKIGGAS